MLPRPAESFKVEQSLASPQFDSFAAAANAAYDGNSFNVAWLGKAGNGSSQHLLTPLTIVNDAGDDFDTVTSPKVDSKYEMRDENSKAMNEPIPLEEPLLTGPQKDVKDAILPKIDEFFRGGGLQGGDPKLLDYITNYLKRPEVNGVLDEAVVDYINFHLDKAGLNGRISSLGGETYLGSLIRHPSRHYEAIWTLGKAVM